MSFNRKAVCPRAGSDGYKSLSCCSPGIFLEPQLIEQSPKGRASLKSKDSCWGHTCIAGSLSFISRIMKKYGCCGFPSVMLRQWVPLNRLLTSEVQSAI